MRGAGGVNPRADCSHIKLPQSVGSCQKNDAGLLLSLDFTLEKAQLAYCIIIQPICNSAPSTEFFLVSTRLPSGRRGEFARVLKQTHK